MRGLFDLPEDGLVSSLALTPDGCYVFAAFGGGEVRLYAQALRTVGAASRSGTIVAQIKSKVRLLYVENGGDNNILYALRVGARAMRGRGGGEQRQEAIASEGGRKRWWRGRDGEGGERWPVCFMGFLFSTHGKSHTSRRGLVQHGPLFAGFQLQLLEEILKFVGKKKKLPCCIQSRTTEVYNKTKYAIGLCRTLPSLATGASSNIHRR